METLEAPRTCEVYGRMARTESERRPWAVILAGGDGVRLRPLTRLISGDDRPKQFCPLFGGQSLLAHTRRRLDGMFAEERTLFVVTKRHEPFYADELKDVDPRQVLVQPVNKGTGAAIAYALLRIMDSDPDADVALFPSDHYYSDEYGFRSAVESALEVVGARPDSALLLGVEATHPETGYGWIEPGPRLLRDSIGHLCTVKRFWEKPSPGTALELLLQGCLWNTFVMVGRARTFFRMLQFTVPDLLQAFFAAGRTGDAADAYLWASLASVDFSREVLSHCAAYLLVARLSPGIGWTDLGEPDRVLSELSRVGMGLRRVPADSETLSGAEARMARAAHSSAVA